MSAAVKDSPCLPPIVPLIPDIERIKVIKMFIKTKLFIASKSNKADNISSYTSDISLKIIKKSR